MKQDFVYHRLSRPQRPVRGNRPRAAVASTAVSEYLAYIATLSIAVVIAIVTFAYAANITVRWLDAAMKPAFLSETSAPASKPQLAMLPAFAPASANSGANN
ncbi:hypothetical protein DLM45_06085 [Hyphomicrobium methylovorum]|uniref:hypothetical protein n=1 Tax=Hyphomicrobium methylovorum TaxID=84 RepID=UPI0015E7145C|nr:hypothetical protein [Hyphomicrobium methylovorum]MBA2125794.1 hypothetical protein [Hyphomicrobium methylovorum]